MLQDTHYLEQLFSLGSSVALFGGVILILLPRRFALLSLIPNLAIPILLSFAYGGLIMVAMHQGNGGDFGSLAGVKKLLSNDAAMLAGWFHYLAFDLFIGAIIAKRADEIGLSRLVQAPILFLTLMAGPLGLFMFYCTYGGWTIFERRRGGSEKNESAA